MGDYLWSVGLRFTCLKSFCIVKIIVNGTKCKKKKTSKRRNIVATFDNLILTISLQLALKVGNKCNYKIIQCSSLISYEVDAGVVLFLQLRSKETVRREWSVCDENVENC